MCAACRTALGIRIKIVRRILCKLLFSFHTACPERTQPRRGHSAACRHQPPHVSLVRLTASRRVLQHGQLARPHNARFARISLFLLYRNSARLLRLLCPASLAMDLQRMVAENQNNPAFLQDIIRMLAQSQSDAGSVHPEDASTAPRPSNTDLLDFSEPHSAPTGIRNSRTQAQASLLRPQPPELPEDSLPEHAPEKKGGRAAGACSKGQQRHRGLTHGKRSEKSSAPETSCPSTPGMTAYRAPRMHCGVYKAPPTGAKFPACRPPDAPHKPQEGDPGHQPPLHGFPWSYDGSIGQTTGTSAGCPQGYPLASAYACLQHRPGILRQPAHCSIQHASPRQPRCGIPPDATARDAKKATAGRICPAAGCMHTHPLAASAPHHASHGDAGPRTTHAVSR